jgi:hypothetical protein
MLIGGLGAAALVAIAVVVLAGGGGGASNKNSPVVLAADETTQQPGYRYDMTVSVAAPGQTLSLTGSGAIDTGPPLSGSMTATIAGQTLNERIVGSYAYVQTAALGSNWGRIYLSGLGGIDSSGSSQFASTDPAALLDYLRASGTVTDEGPQTLSGVATTHYHATIDMNSYAATLPPSQRAAAQTAVAAYQKATGSSTLPVDVWIDHTNLVRQLDMDLSVASQSGNVSVTFSMSFFDYGPQAAVSAPPASQVTDLPSPAGASAPSAAAQTPAPPDPGSSLPAD